MEWRNIPGYEGAYQVSDTGRVRSLDRVVLRRGACSTRRPGKELRPNIGKRGYYTVGLRNSEFEHHRCLVHLLVLKAFVGPRPDGMYTRHLNGNKLDNRLENLAYGTMSENNRDIVRHGNHNHASKTHCKNGHELSERNLYYGRPLATGGRSRRCKTCHKETAARIRDRRKSAA
jgi:hypothetical protein